MTLNDFHASWTHQRSAGWSGVGRGVVGRSVVVRGCVWWGGRGRRCRCVLRAFDVSLQLHREPFAKLLAEAHRLQQVSLVARTTAEDDILHCLRLFQGIHELSSGHSLVVVPKKEKTILGKGTGSDFRGELGRTRNGGGWAVDGRWWRAVLGQCGGWAVEKAVFHISPTPFSSEPQSSSANLTTNSG